MRFSWTIQSPQISLVTYDRNNIMTSNFSELSLKSKTLLRVQLLQRWGWVGYGGLIEGDFTENMLHWPPFILCPSGPDTLGQRTIVRVEVGKRDLSLVKWQRAALSGVVPGVGRHQKGRRFDSPSQHMPGLLARSLYGGVQTTTNRCSPLHLSPSLPLSLK